MEKHNNYKIDFYERKDFDFTGIGLTSCNIIDEALKRGIKARVLLTRYVELEYNGRKAFFYGTANSTMPVTTKQILCNKTETKLFLGQNGLLVPEGKLYTANDIDEILSIKKNIVIKPDTGDFGEMVYCKPGKNQIKSIVKKIIKKFGNVLVEEFAEGNEYRIFITRNKNFEVCMRRPASVLGDGAKKIKELIEEKNKFRQSGDDPIMKVPWHKIEVDDRVLSYLKDQGLTLNSIPEENKRIFLRRNSNLSSGGDGIAMTEKTHPSVKKIALKVLRAIPELPYAGIDMITEDISKDINNNYKIIEVNNMPGLKLHHYPYIGKPQNIASPLIDLVFPETKSS